MRHLIPDEARKWLGTPYKHQGRKIGVGVDCLGLLSETLKSLGATVKDRADYSRYPSQNLLVSGLAEQLTEIPIDQADTGDIFVMAQRKEANHVMIYDKRTETVIHSFFRCGKVVEQPVKIYKNQICKAFRYE